MLQEFCRDFTGHLVLVGSSLGGYVSLAAAPTLHAKGVFLMAPAIYMPGSAAAEARCAHLSHRTGAWLAR